MTGSASKSVPKRPTNSPDYSREFESLQSTFRSGRTRDLDWRRTQLHALEKMMVDNEAELISALAADLGKPAQEAWTAEISYVASDAAYCRKRLGKWTRNRRVSTPLTGWPARSWVQPEPLGTVLIIGAWNYPLQLTLAGLAAAIAAGNCAVIKPSELAPATSAVIAKRLPEYLDAACVRVIEGAVEETSALLELPFDHILYTGGGNVGRIVMRAAAKNLTPVTLELGGKSPCIILPNANLETTARRLAWGKFMNAGQTCIAPDYVLTDRDTEARLLPILENVLRDMFGADPAQSDSYGRIVNGRHFDRLSAFLNDGEIVIGGESDAAERYIAPTVLSGVSADSGIMQEEIFGPVLPILNVPDIDSAIEFVCARDKPLAAYLFGNDAAQEQRFLEQVSAGNICINDTMMFMVVEELPFGGVGPSGMGAYSGESGFRTFSHMKSVMKRGWWPDIPLRYAPYTAKKWNWLRRLR